MTVKVKMLTKGPNGNYRKGEVVEVDQARAAYLIADGHAAPLKDGGGEDDT